MRLQHSWAHRAYRLIRQYFLLFPGFLSSVHSRLSPCALCNTPDEEAFRCLASLPRRFRRLHFACLGDQLLQLALDGGVANMLILQDAVSINYETVGNSGHTEQPRRYSLNPRLAILRPGHLVFGDKLSPLPLVAIQAHAEDDQRLSLKFLGYLPDMRHRPEAG